MIAEVVDAVRTGARLARCDERVRGIGWGLCLRVLLHTHEVGSQIRRTAYADGPPNGRYRGMFTRLIRSILHRLKAPNPTNTTNPIILISATRPYAE